MSWNYTFLSFEAKKRYEKMEGMKTNQNPMFMLRSLWYFISELCFITSIV